MQMATKTFMGAVGLAGALMCVSSVSASTTTFGSNNDGLGGFTTSPTSLLGSDAWSTKADSENYAYTKVQDEGHVASLLHSYTLNRSDGQSYTMKGVVNWTDGYGFNNNRIGLLLFNTADSQTSDGGGGLYLRLNAGHDNVGIMDGINDSNGIQSGSATRVNTVNFTHSQFVGHTLKYKADIQFTGGNINVGFTFTEPDGTKDTTSATVAASDYTGTYFGFGTKLRDHNRVLSNGTREDIPPIVDYKTFSVTNTTPEPASLALMGIGGLALLRRRRRTQV